MNYKVFEMAFYLFGSISAISVFKALQTLSEAKLSYDYGEGVDNLYKTVSKKIVGYQVDTYLFLALAIGFSLFFFIEEPGKGLVIPKESLMFIAFAVVSNLLATIVLILKVRKLKNN